MKPAKFLLIVLALCSAFLASAQRVFICSDYTSYGDPVGTNTSWTISSSGGYVYVLYNNAEPIKTDLWLYVDKYDGSDYKAYDTQMLKAESGKIFIAYKFTFTNEGKYKFRILDASKTLATEYASVAFKDAGSSGSSGGGSTVSQSYYSSSTITFCESIGDNGNPVSPSTVFNIGSQGGWVQVLVKNDKPLQSTGFIVDVYKMIDGKYEFFETKNYTDISPSWAWANFKYTFYSAGDYRFYVYNKESIRINEAYVTVKWK